ncbi:MAG TPA: hypothetical protein PLV03_02340 [Clostridiales bacterium]|nr:hypothetical protein [Clostridiales bacterium]
MPVKRYNGTTQVNETVKRWNGSSWVAQAVKRWNGSSWVNESLTLYTWQKYSLETEILTYKSQIKSTYNFGTSDDDQTTVATSSDFNTATGQFSVSGSANMWENGGGYSLSGDYLDSFSITISGSDPRAGTVYATTYEAVADSTRQVKGTLLGTVTSYTSNAYPDDGIQSGYWYVKI